MRVKKVFVTGAMGFRFHWCKKLLENGYEIYAIDIKKESKNSTITRNLDIIEIVYLTMILLGN